MPNRSNTIHKLKTATMKRRLFVSIVTALLLHLNLYAQQTVKGVLRSPTGEPLSGATVTVKGTSQTVVTNANGEFSINASQGNTLVVSYVGYQTKELTVGTENNLTISLTSVNSSMDEVVVVGYGTQRRRDVTGSVVSVSTKNLPPAANVSINNLLQGRAAGLNLNQRSAQPGGGLSVSIRGAGSPLYVIDGVPLFNNRAPEPGINDKDLGYYGGVDRDPLSTINPADVESIDVLKDASAAAIYGSAAAYGVILITTKKGKAGKINTEYRGSYTAQSPGDYFPFLNAKEFMQEQVRLAKDKFLYDNNLAPYGTSTATPVFTPLFTQAQIDAAGKGTDWLDLLIRNGNIQEHNLSISGGTDRTRIYTSFNYYNNKAVIENSDFARYTGRVNLEQQLSDRLKLSINLTMSQVNSNNAASGSNSGGQEKYNELQAAYAYVPTVDIYDANGAYSKSLNRLITNPAAFFIISDKLKTNRLFLAPNLEVKVLNNLKLNFVGGVDKQGSKRNFYLPREVGNAQLPEGAAQLSTNSIDNYSLEGYGTFNKAINGHSFNVVAGGGYYKNVNESFGLQAVGFFTDALNVYDVNSASNKDKSFMNSFKGESTKISQFLRVNYTYASKYILTFNARRDGSSNFAADKKWGIFPGISLGWQIDRESFLSSSKVVSSLKLRAGYGEVGYDANLNALRLYNRIPDGGYVFGSTLYPGVMLSQLDNSTLSWETDKSSNIGVDYGFLNDRITGSLEVFRRDATDLLRFVPLPVNNAVQRYQTNLGGTTRSEGIDFSVNSKNITGAFRWETLLNISKYRNRWLERSPYDVLNVYQHADDRTDIVYGWKTNGIIRQTSDKPSYMPNARLGNQIFVDQGKDGKLDANDVVALGYRDPKWIFGLGNSFSYKNFDLNIFLYGRIRQYMSNNYAGFYTPSRIAVADALNTLQGIKKVWSVDNPSGIYPGIAANPYAGSNPTGTTDFLQENVSYLKIRNITLGYKFNVKKIIQSARVFADLQNLATFTNYKGYDPELSEANPYPQALSTTIGVSINF
jgi:TonB-linked SusC/RagA family outer membrane protein